MNPPRSSSSAASGGPPTQAIENRVRRALVVIAAVGESCSTTRAYANACGITEPAIAIIVTATANSTQ